MGIWDYKQIKLATITSSKRRGLKKKNNRLRSRAGKTQVSATCYAPEALILRVTCLCSDSIIPFENSCTERSKKFIQNLPGETNNRNSQITLKKNGLFAAKIGELISNVLTLRTLDISSDQFESSLLASSSPAAAIW